MAGTNRGAAQIQSTFEPRSFERFYLTGLGYGNGQGCPTVSPANHTSGNHGWLVRALDFPNNTGARTNVDRPALTKPSPQTRGEARPTAESDRLVGLDWWFEHVHILPRSKIDFGNIITQKQDLYEIYNACREVSVTLTLITNNAEPGTDLPDESPPEVVARQHSMLDASSTTNEGDLFQLGTLVKREIIAEADGLPVFDTTVDFSFPGFNDVQLFVAGTRIVFMPLEYEAPVRETLAFLTDIIGALDGKEQRIALRKQPRQLFEVTYRLTETDRQRMQILLMDWMDNQFGFPLWHEKLVLTAPVSAAATQYPVLGADDVDLRVGGLAVVFTDANTFDVITIAAKTDTLITANDPSVNAYPAGTVLMPLRTAVIRGAVQGVRHANRLEDFRVQFEVTDNDTGALTGSVAAYSSYNGRVLFDDCNVIDAQTMPQEFRRKVYRIDNQTGAISVSSLWDRNKRLHRKGFVLRNRGELMAFRRAMLSLAGRQKAFYIPTFIEDVTVKAALTTGTRTLDIDRIEYERFALNRMPKKIFRITFNNGDPALIRTIVSSASVDATTERLTFDSGEAAWSSTIPANEVERVEFFELVRNDSDNVNIEHVHTGLARCQMPVLQVFDDN